MSCSQLLRKSPSPKAEVSNLIIESLYKLGANVVLPVRLQILYSQTKMT